MTYVCEGIAIVVTRVVFVECYFPAENSRQASKKCSGDSSTHDEKICLIGLGLGRKVSCSDVVKI